MLARARREKNPLPDFLRLLEQGVGGKAAAEQTFGDLRELEKRLEQYVGKHGYYNIHHKATVEVSERAYPRGVSHPRGSPDGPGSNRCGDL